VLGNFGLASGSQPVPNPQDHVCRPHYFNCKNVLFDTGERLAWEILSSETLATSFSIITVNL